MKTILSGLFLIALSSLQAQNVTDYKYVIVPQLFKDFAKDDFQLNIGLKTALRKKDYEVVNENSIPLEVQINPCLATKANIEEVKVMFRNKLKVTFTDCNNAVVSSYEGSSKEKDFTKGYQEALTFAMNQVGKQNAKDLPVTKTENTTIPTVKETTNKVVTQESSKTVEYKNVYKSNGKNYTTASTNNYEFVLIDQENSKVIAQFYPAAQQNVFHVTVISQNGNYQTIGYLNENNIIIEYKTGDKSWSTTTYSK
ncbi:MULTISPECIES: hypothetical protein [Empedobacter]|uniref:Uncharacterized protein n=1 Tax=Empedobacter falsenii TaxID=343874 RepID=A0A7H9DUN5_9FLAO|nr:MULTISPECIES: hypothetical protein [Empedobacter]MDH2207997.1 hypothetical protein [Empedobacter sp. GD03644]QLL58416.1 hypothetical protein FH779_10100 [Empedobacter falsenii]